MPEKYQIPVLDFAFPFLRRHVFGIEPRLPQHWGGLRQECLITSAFRVYHSHLRRYIVSLLHFVNINFYVIISFISICFFYDWYVEKYRLAL